MAGRSGILEGPCGVPLSVQSLRGPRVSLNRPVLCLQLQGYVVAPSPTLSAYLALFIFNQRVFERGRIDGSSAQGRVREGNGVQRPGGTQLHAHPHQFVGVLKVRKRQRSSSLQSSMLRRTLEMSRPPGTVRYTHCGLPTPPLTTFHETHAHSLQVSRAHPPCSAGFLQASATHKEARPP